MAPRQTQDPHSAHPTHEVRLAVVMYGVISLAIYINGVAQELLHVVRGTSPTPGVLSPLEQVYRKIGQHVGPSGKWTAGAPDRIPTTVIIDVLSGTSAGGINAICLANALATGGGTRSFQQLWIDEGNVETLLSDARATPAPVSVLDGDHMFRVLPRAFNHILMKQSSTPPHTLPDTLLAGPSTGSRPPRSSSASESALGRGHGREAYHPLRCATTMPAL